jgi:hydroxyacylglutathione hydrolase
MSFASMLKNSRQWVCLECGYNMIGTMPEFCPFCGARHDQFMSWDDVEKTYRVTRHPVSEFVTQLISQPKLGYEHAAYRIESAEGSVWIDSPSAFNSDLAPVDAIIFTHHHFMGASNLYRNIWGSEVWLHELDAKHQLVTSFEVDRPFNKENFIVHGIEAYHIGGHTPGFTLFIFRDVLFICDYVFLTDAGMHFNPYGPQLETVKQARRIYDLIKDKTLKTVCGYNYVINFDDWWGEFKRLIESH